MGIKFSDDQLEIIKSRNENLLVSAAAGSGKTAVLVERIVERVIDPLNPIDIDRILVVTFTNAAAKEMKERILKALRKAAEEKPEDDHLERQLQLIHKALITTIDSFCLYLVKNHFNVLELDPSMRVAGKAETDLLKSEVMEKLLKDAYESKDADFYALSERYSGKNDDVKISDNILKLYSYAMSYPTPVKWLKDRKKDYCIEDDKFEESELSGYIRKHLKGLCDDALESARRALDICNSGIGPETYADAIYSDIEGLEGTLQAFERGSLYEGLCALRGINRKALSKKACDAADEIKDSVKKIRKDYWDYLNEAKMEFGAFNLNTYAKDMRETGPIINKLIDLTLEFIERFTNEKRDRNIVDFTDMEHYAIDILIDDFKSIDDFTITDIARDYKNYFAEIMIDEYQDSNLVQELILKSISREEEANPNRFMVGDVKQSIYRFRLARPEIFLNKRKKYGTSGEKRLNHLISLSENYRSRDTVVDSVNEVFKDIMTERNGGYTYLPEDYLNARADFKGRPSSEANKTEVLLIDSEVESGTNEVRKEEALAIGQKILDLRKNLQVTDKESGEERPADFGDICVLFRSHSKWLPYIRDAFEEMNIPYHASGSGDFYGTLEIREIVNFLKVINNPLDDISLYGTMTSFFGGFKDGECGEIEAEKEDNEYYLFDKLKGYSQRHPENEKVRDFLARIRMFRELAGYTPVNELLRRLIEETGYGLYVSSKKSGAQRAANLELLMDKASEFAKTSFHGVFHFVKYIELLKKVETEEGEAGINDENSNTVKIMSIHKSKGLEFPICIVGGIDEKFNNSDNKAAFLLDIDVGIGADYIDPDRHVKRGTLIKSLIKERTDFANLGEEIRILYVAMTRAKEKLLLVGACKTGEWLDRVAEGKKNSYLNLMENVLKKAGNSVFKISVWNGARDYRQYVSEDVREEVIYGVLERDDEDVRELCKKIKERFSFTYPHGELSKLYTKTTVSELKIKAMEENEEPAHRMFEETESKVFVPRFAGGEENVKGTDRGSAYHKLLELMDYRSIKPGKEGLEEEKTRLVNNGKISSNELKIINDDKILFFLKSDVCKRMCKADREDKLFKESPFVIGVEASEVEEEFPKEETVLIQGVIDVYFIEDDEIVLLDYKTDRVSEGSELIRRYKTQLDYYKKALTKLTGLRVMECLLYSFSLNEEIRLN